MMSNIENNTATAKAERPRIVIKYAIVSVKTPCALCGQETRAAEASLDLYLEGTDSEVCVECGKKYARGLVEALELLHKAERQNEQERKRLKKSLLDHYSGKEPRKFVQFDGWLHADECMGRREDGQGVTGRASYELMGGADVRVFIPIGEVKKPEALALMRKIMDWIKRDGIESLSKMETGHF